jgi:hypothetical protein
MIQGLGGDTGECRAAIGKSRARNAWHCPLAGARIADTNTEPASIGDVRGRRALRAREHEPAFHHAPALHRKPESVIPVHRSRQRQKSCRWRRDN